MAKIVAVFEIENRGTSLTKDELIALSDYLGNKFAEQGNYQIIPRDEIRKRILSQKEASYKACYDQHCQIEIGRELAAQFTVSSSVSKVGTICLVNSALYDLRMAATAKTATAEGGCTPEELFGALKKVAIRLGESEQAEYQPPPRKEPTLTEEVEKPSTIDAGIEPGLVRFTSEPPGAKVYVDDAQHCARTPCAKTVPAGKHRIAMHWPDDERAVETIWIDEEGQTVHLEAERPITIEDRVNGTEWFGMNLGAGIAGSFNFLVADVYLFTLRWKYFYWTIIEGKVSYYVGFAGGGSRIGGRIGLSQDRLHELRLGLGLAGGMFTTWGGWGYGPIITPHLQYVYNTKHGSVGVGLDLPIGIAVNGDGIAVGPMVYFLWTVH